VEVAYKPARVPPSAELHAVLPRVLDDRASAEERARFAEAWRARVDEILSADLDRVVEIRPLTSRR
jgi:hypothetical protein